MVLGLSHHKSVGISAILRILRGIFSYIMESSMETDDERTLVTGAAVIQSVYETMTATKTISSSPPPKTDGRFISLQLKPKGQPIYQDRLIKLGMLIWLSTGAFA